MHHISSPISGLLSPVMRQGTIRVRLMDPRCENRIYLVSSSR